MHLFDYQARMMAQLRLWALGNILGGGVLMASPSEWWRAFGGMCAAWGLVNLLITLFASRSVQRRRGQHPDLQQGARERRKLRRFLWLNVGLDGVYMLVGLGLVVWGATPILDGFGWAIVLQGAFLLVFDSWHAFRLPADVSAE